MILCFTLSMPNRNSWNGRWNGDDYLYAKIVNFGKTKKGEARAEDILKEKSYYYNFGDGWAANISVKEVTGKESAQIRRKTKGFYGYDWMVESILIDRRIITRDMRRKENERQK